MKTRILSLFLAVAIIITATAMTARTSASEAQVIDGVLIIPEGTVEIPRNAFRGRDDFTSVVIPSSVVRIGGSAFENTALTSVVIPEGVEQIDIGAFRRTQLTSVTLPSTITGMATSSPFSGTTTLVSVTFAEGTTAIPNNAFSGISSLAEIVIPKGVTDIGLRAFFGTALTSVTIPEGVVSISNSAFAETALTSITIPSTVTRMEGAFTRIPTLEKVIFAEGTTSIPGSALSGAESVTEIIIPDTVTEIGSSAFRNCVSLSEITLPAALRQVGSNILSGTNITSLVIPPLLGDPYSQAYLTAPFAGIPTLTHVEFAEGTVYVPGSVLDGLTSVTRVVIPQGVEVIRGSAFRGCVNLTEITLPNSLEHIGGGAFHGTSLTTVTLPPSLTIMSASGIIEGRPTAPTPLGAFANIPTLESVIFAEGTTIIPSYALAGVDHLTWDDITIPHTVTTIGRYAFASCTALTEFVFHEGITTIEEAAFWDTGLSSINLPSTLVTTDPETTRYNGVNPGPGPFARTPSLTKVAFAEGITRIPDYVLYGTQSVTEVNIPGSVTEEGFQAFAGTQWFGNMGGEYGFGRVLNNGDIPTLQDALVILRHLVGLPTPIATDNAAKAAAAITNPTTGEIVIQDALVILRFLVNLPSPRLDAIYLR